MSCHGRMSNCQGVTNVIVHGSTAISAPPNAVGSDQSAGVYDKWMIAPSLGASALDPIRGEYVAIRRMTDSGIRHRPRAGDATVTMPVRVP